MSGEPGKVSPDLLAAAGASPAAAPVDPAAPVPAAPAANWRQEAKEIWQCVGCLSAVFPSLKAVYTDAAIDRLADAWAPVLERHQFTAGKFMIYFVAAAATLPVVIATRDAIRADVKAGKAAAPAADAVAGDAATPAASADVIHFGRAADQPGPPNRPL